MTLFLASAILFLNSLSVAAEFDAAEIQKELNEFRASPTLPLDTLYPRKNDRGTLVRKETAIFDKDEISTEDFVNKKIRGRQPLLESNVKYYSEPTANDNATEIIEDNPFLESIHDMDTESLLKGRVSGEPWSGDYWPYYRGVAAARYSDNAFPASTNWKENFDYIVKNPFSLIFEMGAAEAIDNLSPAEKYDLLMDKDSASLTKSLWQDGRDFYEANGKVETWMGICHGWAPASYMTPRPKQAVTVMAFDGKTPIKFYPDDIKALQTLLWANTRVPTLHLGGRCNEKNPERDENDRIKNPNCRDNNPASWHKSVVNRVGLHKGSFVLDATYDYEVWNQPVVSYSYGYFNPKTMEATKSLQEAIVNRRNFDDDKFKKFRSRQAFSVIGIAMQVTYLVESRPEHSNSDNAEKDQSHTVLYTYDLELDEKGNIVGGEWYRLPHPDFLWSPVKNSQALTKYDYYLLGQENWSGKIVLPQDWRLKAKEAGQQSQPLAKIINSLLDLSNNANSN